MNHADSGAVDWAFVAAVLDQAEKGEVVLDSEIARICRALLATMSELEQVKGERDALKGPINRLVVVLDRNERKGPIPDIEMMFCWMAAQDVRAALAKITGVNA